VTTDNRTEQVTSVPGELHYLDPVSTVLRRFTALGASANTGRSESHVVPIRNARSQQDTFWIDTQGFETAQHRTAVTDFTDKAEVDALYVDEVISFIKERRRRSCTSITARKAPRGRRPASTRSSFRTGAATAGRWPRARGGCSARHRRTAAGAL
jgi:hypothetical protein